MRKSKIFHPVIEIILLVAIQEHKMEKTLDVNLPDKWETNYAEKTDRWDLGGPTPVFKYLASSNRFKPGRMIVPGAGRGHDAREFARHGFDVTAVDFAPYVVREMQRLSDPHAPVEIIQHDLFTLPNEMDHSFDYLLEYTCFCAIDPQRRGEYADLVTRLLKPNGTFIDLAFPLDGRKGGPPFATSEAEVLDLFQRRGFKLMSGEKPEDSIRERRGAEKLLIFQKIN
jgi:SAM-dependent methyltransferase